ncbi:MAG TPA: aldo/keto reductase [Bryobacteraceae bacterium]|jgi:predicted aldo/keto reductase-like oxidoreductase|nr:aldo/keto reductase [Bryobacteraceae bacterium]
MRSITRRQFTGVLTAAGLAPTALGANEIPTRRLGKINFQASIFGIGAQHLGDLNATQANADRVIAEAIDNGVNYIDTAPPYNVSEERLGHALKGKRDKVFLVSKVETTAKGDAMYQIQDSLRKLQTDHLDCVHIHNVGREDRYPSLKQMLASDGTLGALVEAKNKGLIKHIGATCHMRPARAVPVLETGEIELFMCTINFVERHIYKFEEQVLPEARKRNIAVIGMKVLGGPVRGGARLMSPEDYNATLRYAWSVPGLAVAIVGVRTPEELRQAIAAARAFKALEPQEMTSVLDRGKPLAAQWGPLRGPVA